MHRHVPPLLARDPVEPYLKWDFAEDANWHYCLEEVSDGSGERARMGVFPTGDGTRPDEYGCTRLVDDDGSAIGDLFNEAQEGYLVV